MLFSMNTLPNRSYLIMNSTMQGLCLDNNELWRYEEGSYATMTPGVSYATNAVKRGRYLTLGGDDARAYVCGSSG